MIDKPTTLQDHQRRAVQARWARKTPEERSAYAKMMVDAREAKRAAQKAAQAVTDTT
jgi:hypothetical protein